MADPRILDGPTPPTPPLRRCEGDPQDGPSPWSASFVGIGVFLLGILDVASNHLLSEGDLPGALRTGVDVVTTAAVFAGLAVGWRNGFPRWSFPYLALAVSGLVTWSTPELTPLGLPWWLPLALTGAGLLLITRSVWPLRSLARGFWRDWTLLAFGLYALEAIFLLLAFDEAERLLQAAAGVLLLAVLALGALGYMRGRTIARRFASLVEAIVACGLIVTFGPALYWSRYYLPRYSSSPYDGWQWAYALLWTLVLLLVPLSLPALLALAHRASHRPTAVPTV